MLSCRFEDELELLLYWSGPEEQDHDQGMWEADFGAVDQAITDCLDEHKRIVELRIKDYALQGVVERLEVVHGCEGYAAAGGGSLSVW